jgi:tRNA-dihydrouridine synthase
MDEDLYNIVGGEAWAVWEKIKNVVPTWRAAFGNPTIFQELEKYCQRLEAWREKRAPGSVEKTRQMMAALAQARAQAAKQS